MEHSGRGGLSANEIVEITNILEQNSTISPIRLYF